MFKKLFINLLYKMPSYYININRTKQVGKFIIIKHVNGTYTMCILLLNNYNRI